jgi:hypothetical protein
MLGGFPKGLLHRCTITDVADGGCRFASRLRDFRGCSSGLFRVDIQNMNERAMRRKAECDGAPNPAGAARNYRAHAIEAKIRMVIIGVFQNDTP